MSHINGLRLLLVEPDDDVRAAMTNLFELVGCIVETATNAAEALVSTERFAPIVVVSELAFCDGDAFQLARQLRSLPNGKSAILIALTGLYLEGMETKALLAGFRHLLAKPVQFKQIFDILTPIADVRGYALGPLRN